MIDVQKSFSNNSKYGNLYIVPTPIGNLEDITFRSINTLKEVDMIAAEDTIYSKRLFDHYQIDKKTVSYHKFNTKSKTSVLINYLLEGKNIALISDAGMPGINDPGEILIKESIKNNINVITLPGPNAAITALVSSGLNSSEFTYLGFLGKKKSEIEKQVKVLKGNQSYIFYESPHRIHKTIQFLAEILDSKTKVVIARELTKKFEEYIRGTVEEVNSYISENEIKGEIVLIIESKKEEIEKLSPQEGADKVKELMNEENIKLSKAVSIISKKYSIDRKILYNISK